MGVLRALSRREVMMPPYGGRLRRRGLPWYNSQRLAVLVAHPHAAFTFLANRTGQCSMSDVKEGGFGYCEERTPNLGRLESRGAELLDQQTDDGL